ncbi:MAG: hypothetical protein MR393_12245 [Intestinimonas massiliensis]|uniref:hypothetical protein n=1 Tax=Intestinimonas TaxID=1392389 RepID=UPI002430A84D|nr:MULTISPECIES: hypothetical protein [Intestinimonas]MCI5563882.1 hypothetical protein [Intestinimonas massiliensis (ex Afouda et al. 2020)]MDY5340141.1 hypothetical protein [Intestinimonas sp.]
MSHAHSGGRKYLLYGGRNTGRQIASITVALEGVRYRLELPQKERFLVSAEIDNRIASDRLDLDLVTLWNAAGEEITGKYDLSGGGI